MRIVRPLITAVLIVLAASVPAWAGSYTVIDQAGRDVTVPDRPTRIIALAPNITEILFAVGAGGSIVGVSEYSDYPPGAAGLPEVGTYIKPNLEAIIALKPDLVIATADGEKRVEINRLASLGVAVYIINPRTIAGVVSTVREIGRLSGNEKAAEETAREMEKRIEEIKTRVVSLPKVSALLVLNTNPLITVNGNTFQDEMIRTAGGKNIAAAEPIRYPTLTYEEVVVRAPEVIIMTTMSPDQDYRSVIAGWLRFSTVPAVKQREGLCRRFGYRGPSLAPDGRGSGGIGAAASPGGLQKGRGRGAVMRHGARIGLSVLVLSIPAAAAVVISLAVGTAPIGLMDVARALFSPDRVSPEVLMIVRDLRLPRVLMALVAGGALSVSGVVFQAILKNPLADPFILGVSSGAALGTVIGALVISVPSYAAWRLAGLCRGDDDHPHRLLRLPDQGAALPEHDAFSGCYHQRLFLGGHHGHHLAVSQQRIAEHLLLADGRPLAGLDDGGRRRLLRVFAAASVVVFYYARPMNLLLFGEESAASGGVDVERTKRVLFIAASLMTAAVVSAAGVIGFVGLIIPHMIRMVLGPDHRVLIPSSILLGGTFLLLSDTVARTVVAPMELPVGVLTALLGAPFFVYLLRRQM